MLRELLLATPICILAAHANATTWYGSEFRTPQVIPRGDIAACVNPRDLEKFSNLVIAGRVDRYSKMDCFHIKEDEPVTLLEDSGDYIQIIGKHDGKEYDVWTKAFMFDNSDEHKSHSERIAESKNGQGAEVSPSSSEPPTLAEIEKANRTAETVTCMVEEGRSDAECSQEAQLDLDKID